MPHNYPLESLEPGLDESAFYDPPNFAFSNGVHVCEVEVDPETGAAELVSYHAVDDIGTVINPMIVEGQVHGGLAQGIGQALAERTVYDAGQLLSALLHGLRAAARRRSAGFFSETDETQPCTHNPLGAKGCGEAGRHRGAGGGDERAPRCAAGLPTWKCRLRRTASGKP